jgi:hypothetical protein
MHISILGELQEANAAVGFIGRVYRPRGNLK